MGIRRCVLGVLLAVVAVGAAAGSTSANTSLPACTTGATGTLVPALQDFAVNQGLESYSSTSSSVTGRLVRGKETLVRAYLTLPSTCTGAITITGAVLTANVAGTSYTLSPFAGTGTGSVASTLQSTSTSDPLFVVPASDLASADGTLPFTVSWTLNVTFTQNRSATPEAMSPRRLTIDHASNAVERGGRSSSTSHSSSVGDSRSREDLPTGFGNQSSSGVRATPGKVALPRRDECGTQGVTTGAARETAASAGRHAQRMRPSITVAVSRRYSLTRTLLDPSSRKENRTVGRTIHAALTFDPE